MRTFGTQHRGGTRIHGDALVPRFLRGYLQIHAFGMVNSNEEVKRKWSQHRRHISEVPMLWVGMLPQLGIVSDDLRLGLREGRSSIELRWPPAKKRVWASAWCYGLRPNYMIGLTWWGGDVTELAYLRQAARHHLRPPQRGCGVSGNGGSNEPWN